MRAIEFRPRAVMDLDGIMVYTAYELGQPKAAQQIADALYQAIEDLAEHPETGRILHDEDLERTYRRILVKRYWIYYSHTSATLTIWRIFHTTQDHDAYGFESFFLSPSSILRY